VLAEGSSQREFKESVLELTRQRATAKDLLQHPFIRSARKTSDLAQLVRRYETFRQQHGKPPAAVPETGTIMGGTVNSTWDFDETIRGTIKGAPVAFDLALLRESTSSEDDEVCVGVVAMLTCSRLLRLLLLRGRQQSSRGPALSWKMGKCGLIDSGFSAKINLRKPSYPTLLLTGHCLSFFPGISL
jgi:hypothetical protein